MNMHKNTRLTPHHRQAIWLAYTQEKESITSLARRYQVSRVTIYRALKAARAKLLKPQTSTNNRFKQAKYGMKRLAKVERSIQEKLKRQAKRYNKSYPGEAAFRKNSKGRPNATTSPIPAKWCTSIPNDCRCSKGRKPPTNEITCLSPLMISQENCTPPSCRTKPQTVRPSS